MYASKKNSIFNSIMKYLINIGGLISFLAVILSFSLNSVSDIKVYKNLKEALQSPDEVTHLKLVRKKYREFPLEILKLKNLTHLDLSKNRMDSIPNVIKSLVNLEELKIKSNNFTQFPEALCQLSSLKKLSLAENSIENIPNGISEMRNLVELDLYRNSVSSISSEIKNLYSLKRLDLRMIELNDEKQERIRALLPNTKVLLTEPCNCATY
jgi:Leucine-rich repeat (LRR) protein